MKKCHNYVHWSNIPNVKEGLDPNLLLGPYPTHPLCSAYIVTLLYSNYATSIEKVGEYPNLVGDCAVPGSGDVVWCVTDMLAMYFNKNASFEDICARADRHWRNVAYQDRLVDGLRAAASIKNKFKERLENWPRK